MCIRDRSISATSEKKLRSIRKNHVISRLCGDLGIRWKRFKIPQKSVENMERKWGKMKKKWYKKSGIKAFFICLTIVFLVTACVSAGASVYVMSKGVQPLDSRKFVSYTHLDVYKRQSGMHVYL